MTARSPRVDTGLSAGTCTCQRLDLWLPAYGDRLFDDTLAWVTTAGKRFFNQSRGYSGDGPVPLC
jgi:hypothetical protein